MGYLEQSQDAGRTLLPDLVRVFALIGIALVNVALLAYPMNTGFHGGALVTMADKGADFFVNSIFTLKSYTLFSFMFGVGFAFQMKGAQTRGKGFGARYSRRIIGLFVLGALHGAFLYQGDILFLYGILGTILFLFRNASAKTLVKTGIGVYVFQTIIIALGTIAIYLGHQFAPEEMAKELVNMQEADAKSLAAYGFGTFMEAASARVIEWLQIVGFGSMFQGFGAFAFFLFGLAAVKSDIIANPSAPIWSKFRRVFLPIGLIGSAIGAYLFITADNMIDTQMMVGMLILTAASPFSTAGYLGLIAKWAEGPMTGFKTFMARGGTATLTAYLMQSLLMSFIFCGYGLGYYAKLGAAQCIAIALGVAIFTIVFASVWRKYFKRGLMENLLRSWTYLGKR